MFGWAILLLWQASTLQADIARELAADPYAPSTLLASDPYVGASLASDPYGAAPVFVLAPDPYSLPPFSLEADPYDARPIPLLAPDPYDAPSNSL